MVIDDDFNIVATPMPKFFNFGELKAHQIPKSKNWIITRKEDGSLGILFMYNGNLIVATRGSFQSEQAQWVYDNLNRLYPDFVLRDGRTLYVEIIYPENQIVLDYAGQEKLVLLGAYDEKENRELHHDELSDLNLPFPVVMAYDGEWKQFLKMDIPGEEGVVVRWPYDGNFRMKVKFQNYVELHRIMTNTSEVTVWEWFERGDKTTIAALPDELYAWANNLYEEWENEFNAYKTANIQVFAEISKRRNATREFRKKFATLAYQKQTEVANVLPSVQFAYLDMQDDDSINSLIKNHMKKEKNF